MISHFSKLHHYISHIRVFLCQRNKKYSEVAHRYVMHIYFSEYYKEYSLHLIFHLLTGLRKKNYRRNIATMNIRHLLKAKIFIVTFNSNVGMEKEIQQRQMRYHHIPLLLIVFFSLFKRSQ